MTYQPRIYPEIVRDLLTTLTGGTVQESLLAKDSAVTDKLARRPVRRVSHLAGRVQVGTGATAREIAYAFTSADFELVATSGDGDLDAIRFRDGAPRPVPGTRIVVNYYPLTTAPLPLTDLNVGSVTRTLMETVARELSVLYGQLGHVYDSAFLETAKGDALDNVTALVGVKRLPPGHPIAGLVFSRHEGSPGRITVPAGTAVLDADGNRYLTLVALTFEPSETSREVDAGGQGPDTELVAEDTLTRIEITIAGISSVTNPSPARAAGARETDEAFRRRARGALHGTVRGTLDALRFGLESLPAVQSVSLVERPNGVFGEVRIDVAYREDSPAARAEVDARIKELRPAGVRVFQDAAARLRVDLRVDLVLAGGGIPATELGALKKAVEATLIPALQAVPPGGKLRRAPLAALVLADKRIADVELTLITDTGEFTELALEDGETLDVQLPFAFTIQAEEQVTGPAMSTSVSAVLPVHLLSQVTLADASQQINLRLASYLAELGPQRPLTVDGLAAAIRDETRFGLVRADVQVTIETSEGRFLQLTDGSGSYAPLLEERLESGLIQVEPREGSLA